MIEKVEAWKDSKGRLFTTKNDAVTAEFKTRVDRALQSGPSDIYNKSGADIVGLLTSTTYRTRSLLLEALQWYEENRGHPDT